MAHAALLDRISKHIAAVATNPAEAIDANLLAQLDRHVNQSISKDERQGLLEQLSVLLPILQQDPSPVTSLINVLIDSDAYTFSDVLAISPPIDFAAGLTSPAESINLLTLSLLAKAGGTVSDVGIVASKQDVVAALINCWLRTPSTAVAEKARKTLAGLILVEGPGRPLGEQKDIVDFRGDKSLSGISQGLMWHRVFGDKDVYGLFFSLCSLTTVGQPGQLSKRDKSIAQARLLAFLEELLPLRQIWKTQISAVEAAYGVKDGLLEFVAVRMVDYKEDPILHMALVEFFTNLISLPDPEPSVDNTIDHVSLSMQGLSFMMSMGLHERTMSYYLQPEKHDPIEVSLLYSRCARYLAAYAAQHPVHLLQGPVADHILRRLTLVLNDVSGSQWARNDAPVHDLHVLVSLPRELLLPRLRAETPLFSLPPHPPNADAFKALAAIFHGPDGQHVRTEERAAARALYLLYLQRHTDFWDRLVNASSIIALKETALAAISLMKAILDANWQTSSSRTPAEPMSSVNYPQMLEPQLEETCRYYPVPLPAVGVAAFLHPDILGKVVPWLTQPVQAAATMLGGDSESSTYKIAMAKYDLVMVMDRELRGLAEQLPDQAETLNSLSALVTRRLGQGPLVTDSGAGGRVATLEL